MAYGEYTPTYLGLTTPGENRYETANATIIHEAGRVTFQATIISRADMQAYNRALDTTQRALSRLRYPPKQPAHGSTSRRREKLRKAGIRR